MTHGTHSLASHGRRRQVNQEENKKTVSKNTMTEPDTSTVGCGTDGFGDALHSLCRTVCKLRLTQLSRKRWENYLCFGREYPAVQRSFSPAEEFQWTEREKVRAEDCDVP